MKSVRLFFLAALVFVVPAIAQEGHPLTGTWYGDFGMTQGQRNDLTVVMEWNGANATGIVNPGPKAVTIKTAKLDVKLGSPGQGRGQAQGGNAAQPAVAPRVSWFTLKWRQKIGRAVSITSSLQLWVPGRAATRGGIFGSAGFSTAKL